MVFKIGAHVSIQGSFSKALEREKGVGGNCGQIFIKSPRSWNMPNISEEEAEEFSQNYEASGMKPFMVHSTYLINLATPKEDLFNKSIECLRGEIRRTDRLELPYITFHPGSHTGSGEQKGLKKIIKGLDKLKDTLKEVDTQLLLENTAGKGTTLGYSMEQLEEMIKGTKTPDIGVCLDTAHAFGAGYDFRTEKGINETVEKIEKAFGIEKIKMIHLNDSKAPLGSKKDQHAHGTNGEMGKKGIGNIVNHKAFRDIPMIRETNVPKVDIAIAKEVRIEE